MAAKTWDNQAVRSTFLLAKAAKRRGQFSLLRPRLVSSASGLRDCVAQATKNSLWISYEEDLTEALLRGLSWPVRSIGVAVFLHALKPRTLPALASCFRRFAFSADGGFLPPQELAETLEAENRSVLFIGGSVDQASQTITLWRGNLEPLTVPFSAFEKSGDGIEPDFTRFSVTDHGQTIRLGHYESATDAILYEFDPAFRRQVAKERQASERSFGASLRRLRKQRGLRREDFGPNVAAKTIARIEQGKVRRIHKRTLACIAERLRVKPEDIETY